MTPFYQFTIDTVRDDLLPLMTKIVHDAPGAAAEFSLTYDYIYDKIGQWLKQQPKHFDLKKMLPRQIHSQPPEEALLSYMMNLAVLACANGDSLVRTDLRRKIDALVIAGNKKDLSEAKTARYVIANRSIGR
ncbi:MAG: hypothetical protein ACOYNL_02675 [Rickettsiales bacterium]